MTKQHKQELQEAKILQGSIKNKRINTNAKGRRSEIKTQQWLEKNGWVVQTTRRSSYKGGSNDFFGLFDHIAVCQKDWATIHRSKKGKDKKFVLGERKNFYLGTTLFVQTKSNRVAKKILEKIDNFPARNKAVFIWHDNINEPEIFLAC